MQRLVIKERAQKYHYLTLKSSSADGILSGEAAGEGICICERKATVYSVQPSLK
jgi:hypothetical protein